MRILQSEIFVHTYGQLRAAHLILGYKPISTSFYAPKYVIKAKDPRLHQINIPMPSFLTGPPPAGIHLVELPAQRAPKEEAISLKPALEEEITKVIEVADSSKDFDKDFGAFNQSSTAESLLDLFSHLPPHKLVVVKRHPTFLKLWCSKGS